MQPSWVSPKGCPIWVNARFEKPGDDDIVNVEDSFRFTVHLTGSAYTSRP